MIEIWKETDCGIKVSDMGRVMSGKGRLLKCSGTRDTGKQVRDSKGKWHLVARLVCEAFHENPEGKSQVDHINGDRMDNRACNLRWATQSENVKYSFTQTERKMVWLFRLTKGQYSKAFVGAAQAARELGLMRRKLSLALKMGKSEYKGYSIELIARAEA